MISITKKEYEKEFIQKGYEQFTEDQFRKWIDLNSDILVKGEQGMLEDDIEKAEYEAFKEEIRSFTAVEVVEPSPISKFRIEKSIMYVRPNQVEWDEPELIKGEDGEDIQKARSGRYKDTRLNRKLGRVGNPYGSKKGTEEKKEEGKGKQEGKIEVGDMIPLGPNSRGSMSYGEVQSIKDDTVKVRMSGGQIMDLSMAGALHYLKAGGVKPVIEKVKQSPSSSTEDKGKSEKKEESGEYSKELTNKLNSLTPSQKFYVAQRATGERIYSGDSNFRKDSDKGTDRLLTYLKRNNISEEEVSNNLDKWKKF